MLGYLVVLVFNVPPTAKVIWRRGHGLKSHPTDWRSRESNLRPLVYKASALSTTPQRLLECWDIRPGIHKIPVRIANKEDPDQTASSEAV